MGNALAGQGVYQTKVKYTENKPIQTLFFGQKALLRLIFCHNQLNHYKTLPQEGPYIYTYKGVAHQSRAW